MSAQEEFAEAVKTTFGPALRAAGLRGSGRSYSLPSDSHFALLGFQKSQFSDADCVKFTVNVKVVPKAAWAARRAERPHFPVKPSPNTGYGTFEWHQRIGALLPGGEDRWWCFRRREDNTATVTEVVGVLIDVAVPAIRNAVNSTST